LALAFLLAALLGDIDPSLKLLLFYASIVEHSYFLVNLLYPIKDRGTKTIAYVKIRIGTIKNGSRIAFPKLGIN